MFDAGGCNGDDAVVGGALGVASGDEMAPAGVVDGAALISVTIAGRGGTAGEHAVNTIKTMMEHFRHRTMTLALL
jgi:hypothetical protein